MRTWWISPKAAGTVITNTTTISMAEEAGNAALAGDNRACSNGRSGKDRSGDDIPSAEGRGYTKKPLCYGYGQEGE